MDDVLKKIIELIGDQRGAKTKFLKALNLGSSTLGDWQSGRITSYLKIIPQIAEYFDVSTDYLLGKEPRQIKGVKIPVYGSISAGLPLLAVEDIIDYEEIEEEMARDGKHIGLRIKGQSMEPRMYDGDVIIVRLQPNVESGEVAAVRVNGDEVTCKRVIKHTNGISLNSNNPSFTPMFFTNDQVEQLPVDIIGKVVELRGKSRF